jgi:hypothetical protein
MRSAEGTSAPTEKSAIVSHSPMTPNLASQTIVEPCRKADKILLSARNKSGVGGTKAEHSLRGFLVGDHTA